MKKIFSMFLTLCMVVTLHPVTAMAEGIHTAIGTRGEIISFAPLTETEKTVSLGTSMEDLELPETLAATVRTVVTPAEEPVLDSGSSDADVSGTPAGEAAPQEPAQNSGSPEEGITAGDSVAATTGSAIEVVVSEPEEMGEATDPEWEENIMELEVTWACADYDSDSEGAYVFTPMIEGYTVSAPLPEITVTVDKDSHKYLMSEPVTYVAQIGETGYVTLQAAINSAANNQTIQLLEDVTVEETVTIPGNSFTLDLNGKTLDNSVNIYALIRLGSGTLTIADSSDEKSGTIKGSKARVAINTGSSGSINVCGGTVTNNDQATIQHSSTGAVNVSGGTVESNNFVAIHNHSKGSVNVSGGTVKCTNSSGVAILNNSTGKITISGNATVTSEHTYGGRGTIHLMQGTDSDTVLEITGGTIENNSIYRLNHAIKNDASGKIKILSGTPVIRSTGFAAMNTAPELGDYANVEVTASANYDGSSPVAYKAESITSYRYLTFAIKTGTTVTNLNLTNKLTAPVIGSTPEKSISDDQYTGTVTWSGNPSNFSGNTAYTATITLTAAEGYTFSGVAEMTFSYIGATSVNNYAGIGNRLTVSITFPATAVKALQSITITTPPKRTAYNYGETFDKTGMVVKAIYNDGTENPDFTDYKVDKTDTLTLSDTTITLTANSTSITTTQLITIKKTPTMADLSYGLTAVNYDGSTKPVSVTAGSGKTLGVITVKYNGDTTAPINAGTYAITVDIAGNASYYVVTELYLGNYTINKVDYTGTKTVSASVLVSGQVGAAVKLPALPAGASYDTPVAGGTISMTGMNIAGTTLTYTAPKSTAGQTGTMTIPVTSANHNNYSIVVTVTYTAKTPQAISYAAPTVAKTYGDVKFINPLTRTTVNGTINYTSDDTSVATVNPSTGEVTIVSVGDGSATITATAAETDTHAQAAASYTVTVTKTALTLKADDKSMANGDGLPTFTYTATGFVGGDAVTTPPTMSTVTDGTAVGTFDITIAGGVVANAASYNITYTKGTLTVAERLFTTIVTNDTGSGSYAESATVTITANDRSGYSFTGWSGADVTFADASAKTTTFTMPAKAVTVTASYRQNSSGGGGSSSNGNSSPVIVTPPVPDKPNLPTQVEIKVPGTVDSKGNVTVSITDKTVTDAFDKALADAKKNGNEQNGITVVLRVDTGNKTGSHVTVNLPKAVQDVIISKGIVNTVVVLDNPDIRVSMDLATVQEINKQAKSDVNISATRTDSGKLTVEAKNAIGIRPVFDLKVNYGNGKQVHNFGAGSVSVTIPYTLGANEKAGNVQAVYVDDKGKVHWLVNSVYDSVEKVLRFTTSHFSAYGIGYKQDNTALTDIAGHWAKEDVEFVVSRGLIGGTTATTFSPNSAMTRGMFVTALGRLVHADVSGYKKSSFSDVKDDAYYMGYIEWANKNNIVNGVGNNKFAPDQSITREQMAVIMSGYAKTIGYPLPKVHVECIFTDNDKISAYAKEAVKQMQMAGVISGINGNLFDPQGTATRAKVSAVLRRFVELVISSDTAQGWTMNDSGKWMYFEDGKPVTGQKDIDGSAYTFDRYGVTADVPKNLRYTAYIVQKGDSFWSISRKLDCPMSELERLNNKSRFSNIYPGDVLRVPEK